MRSTACFVREKAPRVWGSVARVGDIERVLSVGAEGFGDWTP
jgi:hypothetical protein